MKTLLSSFALCASLISVNALSAEISEVVESSSTETIKIKSAKGSISVQGWDENKIKISGDVDGNYQLNQSGELTVFEASAKNAEHSLKFLVPNNAELAIDSSDANILLKNVRGGVTANSVNGNVDASKLRKHVEIKSLNGDISLNNTSGYVVLETVNGNISVLGVSGDAVLSSVSGNVDINSNIAALQATNVSGSTSANINGAKNLKLNSVNGQIKVNTSLAKNAKISVTSVKGNIDFNVPENTSAKFRVNTHENGSISNKITQDSAKPVKQGPASELYFKTQSGDAKIDINTVGGNVALGLSTALNEPQKPATNQVVDINNIDSSFFDLAYVRPDTDLSHYKKVFIGDVSVEFDKRWLKKFGGGDAQQYRKRTLKIYSKMLKKQLAKNFEDDFGVKVVSERGHDVLVVLPKVLDLNIIEPEAAELKDTILSWAGDAKVDVTVYSPEDKAVIALFVDHRQTKRFGFAEISMPTRLANERSFRKLFDKWSKNVVKQLKNAN